jgi:outer membrane protein OmpA-like peptidoglycan-associated protein
MVVKPLAMAIVAVTLCACGILPDNRPASIGFNYRVENAAANGIIQTFDMGGNTIVQIRDIEKHTPFFLDAQNIEIPFKLIGQTAVLQGVHQAFTVVSERATARIVRTVGADARPVERAAPAAAARALLPSPVPQPVPAERNDPGQDLASAIQKISRELAELKALLAASDHGKRESTEIAAPPHLARQEEVPATISVTFRNQSDIFEPTTEARATILARARHASAITVRGYTDSTVPTASAALLAKSRAMAAKQYLLSNGVQGDKISVGFEAAGKFISDNKTKAGKELNRRVEISIT